MIKINNVTIPTPSVYAVSVMDISRADRNANGEMILEIITTKRKIEMTWLYLSQSDLSALLGKISSGFFTVEYVDPEDGVKTGTFYVGDRKAGAIDYQNGAIRWKDVGFNFIQK
jgi:hypothetical protein